MRHAIKESYQKELHSKKEKELKRINRLTTFDDEDSIEDYLEENTIKRLYKKFYKFLETKYDFKICPLYDLNVNSFDQSVNNSFSNSGSFDSHNFVNITNHKNNIIKMLRPSQLYTKEKCCDFIKWITSIFQTINDLEICDYYNVI